MGNLIERHELLKRLQEGEIFREGSWEKNKLRYVGYDLRIADDFLILPNGEEDTGSNNDVYKYNKGQKRDQIIYLKPGQTIFVSTKERICMPWDVYGNIGTKFRLVSKGILLFTGLMLEPGFGMEKINNKWQPVNDERIHFFLSNVGEKEFEIIPNETVVAAVQFFKINEIPESERNEVKVLYGNSFIKNMFKKPDFNSGVVFFKKTNDKISETNKKIEDTNSKINVLEQNINRLSTILTKVESGSNLILMFGIYLISVTIFGVAFASILSFIQKIEPDNILNNPYNTVMGGLSMIFLGAIVITMFIITIKIVKLHKDERNRN